MNIENIPTKKDSEIPLEMYEIPGQENITEHTFQRYLKDKTQDIDINKLAATSSHSLDKEIKKLTKEELVPLLREKLYDSNLLSQELLLKTINYIPVTERFSLIKEGLENNDINVQKNAARLLSYVDEGDYAELHLLVATKAMEGLQKPDMEAKKTATSMIWFASSSQMKGLWSTAEEEMNKGLSNPDSNTRKKAIQLIVHFPLSEREELFKEKFLNNPDIEIRKLAMSMLWCAPAELIVPAVEQGLESSDPEMQKISARMLKYGVMSEKPYLLGNKIMESKELTNELVKSVIYDRNLITEDEFKRQSFDKTGSETTLLGGELKNKAIIRHIKPKAFLAWQKAYEDSELWQKNGFNYVPIEPILSYKVNKEGLVDVYSGVLDLDFDRWNRVAYKFCKELERKIESIFNILVNKDILHGHAHKSNFCLKFFRDSEGNVDLKKEPRVYMIDFDQATSPGSVENR